MIKKGVLKSVYIFSSATIICFITACTPMQRDFRELIQPVARDSGFKMDGYWIWGGSVIKADSTYHMFASRWDKEQAFPKGYKWKSEIVHATSNSYTGPYTFEEVIIGERDSLYWDSNMAHNPTIHKIKNEYVLFYNGSDFTTFRDSSKALLRRVGYATAPTVNGPWTRSDTPLFESEGNNPAVYVENGDGIKLVFRDEALRVSIATAPTFEGPYTIENHNAWPSALIEDYYLFKKNNQYHIICEDNKGDVSGHYRWGLHLVSDDGIHNWKKYDPLIAYDHNIRYNDGTSLHCTRRERPQLYMENGEVFGFTTAVYNGTDSWCQPVELYPRY